MKVRIVNDMYGYAVQIKPWWSPLWFEPRINTHIKLEDAEAYACKYLNAGTVVKKMTAGDCKCETINKTVGIE